MDNQTFTLYHQPKCLAATLILMSGGFLAPEAQAACGDSATLIHAIQGNVAISPLLGNVVELEGIVTGDFQHGLSGTYRDLDGFFVQEEDSDADADPGTSEGIYIFEGESPIVDVQAGDRVRVTGTVEEYFTHTQISSISSVDICASGQALPTSMNVALPVSALEDFEKYEGMRINFQPLVIGAHFNFDRYGEIILTTERLQQPTAIFDPGSPEAADLTDLNKRSQIILDDGRRSENPDPALHPDGNSFSLSNLFRSGDTLSGVSGVLEYRHDRYRVHATQPAVHTEINHRTPQPEHVGGTLKVASVNLLNYFNGNGLGGGFPTPWGADTLDEFNRQRAKTIAALIAIDADIIGVMELENDGYSATSAIQDLVDGLNAVTAPTTYAFIDPLVPQLGVGTITNGLLYKPSKVTPSGDPSILSSAVDPNFLSPRNRPSLAQTFEEDSSGELLTVVVNHFKSKASACDDVGDVDTGDGSGNCNLTRTKAAQALADWIDTDPTGSSDTDFLIIGDLNSLDMEDPIDALTDAGYTDLLLDSNGGFEYSFIFNALHGYLDYAMTSPQLTGQVQGVTVWHINADEPDLIDYDTTFKAPAQAAIYAPDQYRASDHDPVIVGFNLGRPGIIFSDGFENN